MGLIGKIVGRWVGGGGVNSRVCVNVVYVRGCEYCVCEGVCKCCVWGDVNIVWGLCEYCVGEGVCKRCACEGMWILCVRVVLVLGVCEYLVCVNIMCWG